MPVDAGGIQVRFDVKRGFRHSVSCPPDPEPDPIDCCRMTFGTVKERSSARGIGGRFVGILEKSPDREEKTDGLS